MAEADLTVTIPDRDVLKHTRRVPAKAPVLQLVPRAKAPEPTANPVVVRVLEETLERARRGELAGVSVISYGQDWSWHTHNAGNVLSVPAVGVAAAHMLGSQLERRLRMAKDGGGQ